MKSKPADMRTWIILTVLLALSPRVWGQDTLQTAPALPEIAPREVEIRGELVISFPSLERQPLIGFNPPPRVYQVPPDRKPIIHPYKQEVTSLPPLPLRRPPQLAPTAAAIEPAYGYLEGSLGTYLTRTGLLDVDYPLSPLMRLQAHGNYAGRTGYHPFAEHPDSLLRQVQAPFNRFEGSFGIVLGRRQGPLSVAWKLLSATEQHRVYGALPDADGRQPERSAFALGTHMEMNARLTPAVRMATALTYRTGDTALDLPATGTSSSHTYHDLTYSLNLSLSRITLGGLAAFHTLTDNRRDARIVTYAPEIRYDHPDRITAGVRLLGLSTRQSDGATRRLLYVAPLIRLEASAGPFALRLSSAPYVEPVQLFDLLRENPYLHLGTPSAQMPYLESTLYPWNLLARLRLSSGSLRMDADFTYRYAPNWRTYQEARSPGFFTFTHNAAEVYAGSLHLTAISASRARATLSATLRASALTRASGTSAIPYLPHQELRGRLELPFFNHRLKTVLDLRILAGRYTDTGATQKLPDTWLLSTYVTWKWSHILGMRLSAENLSTREPVYWTGYPEARNILRIGAFLNW